MSQEETTGGHRIFTNRNGLSVHFSGFSVVELTDAKDHPLRRQATDCSECGAKGTVFFNPGNVEVQCHHQGCRELDIERRQYHLNVWAEAVIVARDFGGSG